MTFHSEYGQDKWLDEHIFKGQRDGVFVEFGALNGLLHSNSLFFERERAWRGVCMEANPLIWPELSVNRPLAKKVLAAIYDQPGKIEFERIDGGLYGWSGVKGDIEPDHWARIEKHVPKAMRKTVEVRCVTLKWALDACGIKHVDYMSIDVEGAEYKILSVFPFREFDIRVMAVEDNFGNPALDELMINNGYEKIARIGPDNIWEKNELALA